LDDQKNPRVAIKKLKDPDRDLIDREVKGLEIMRDANHDHLVKAIAYYRYKGGHFFMFPFTEQGNLWEFWTNKENVSILDRPYLTWVFDQLTGLARGIEKIHHPPSGDHLRHGDLKPENILCFKAKQQGRTGGKGIPKTRLVITDVGLARAHNTSTKKNRPSTNTTVSTDRYLAPEMRTNPGVLGRRFDIWSMGCVFLEFAIWVLYGADELKRCTEKNSEFFELHEASEREPEKGNLLKVPTTTPEPLWASRHPVVNDWIDYLKDDWRCSGKTALGQLVKLIDEWMLVVEVEELKASQLFIKRVTTGIAGQPDDFSRKEGYRTYAQAMVKDLEEIMAGLREGRIEAISAPRPGALTPKGPSKGEGLPSVVVLRTV
jgi:serine/threonine protein kinase